MKNKRNLIFAVSLLLALLAVLPAFGQNKADSPLYPVTTDISRIYPYRLGYVVAYKKGPATKLIYIPNEWFELTPGEDAPKAERFFLKPGKVVPHIVVYYTEGGEFRNVRLYVRQERGHPSWGTIDASENLDAQFADAVSAGKIVIDYP